MAETSGPWDSAGFLEADWSEMVGDWFGAGVHGTPLTTELQVYADASGMQVKVRAGRATVLGQKYKLSAEQIVTIPNGNTSPRIDRVVLRRDDVANTILLFRIAGTPAATPTAPALTAQDLPLAQVTVAANLTTSIAAGAVADDRRHFPLGVIPALSTRKPSTPKPGQAIYCTDNGQAQMWNGVLWARIPLGDTGWVTVAGGQFSTGWTNYTGGGSYPVGIQVRKLGDEVLVRGLLVRSGAAIAAGAFLSGTTSPLTLPLGYLPGKSHAFASVTSNADSVLGLIDTAGKLSLRLAGALGTGNYVPLTTSFTID